MNLDKILEKIKLEDKCRNFNWFLAQFKKGRLYTRNGVKYNEEMVKDFRLAIKCVNEIYEEHWDIDILLRKKDSKLCISLESIIIHFPLVKIKNSVNLEHTIKNLFVGVDIGYKASNERLSFSGIKGGRMTQSFAEDSSGYAHSHLPGLTMSTTTGKAPYYSSFCTGSGEINLYMADINTDGFSEESLIRFFIQLNTLVHWESLEGTPFRYIKRISVKSNNSTKYIVPVENTVLNFYSSILTHYRMAKCTPDLEFYSLGGEYFVVEGEKLDTFILSVSLTEREKESILCLINEEGVIISYTNSIGNEKQRLRGTYIFKGIKKVSIIEANPGAQNKKVNYTIHPTARRIIINKINNDANIKTIRQGTIRRYQN